MHLFLLIFISLFSFNREEWIPSHVWKRTRTLILQRDIQGSSWICKYSHFKSNKKSDFDIDHIVPLHYASTHCGESLSADEKEAFATDEHNLITVYDKENRKKSDKGPSEYYPEFGDYFYALQWKYITSQYHICMDSSDSAVVDEHLKVRKLE